METQTSGQLWSLQSGSTNQPTLSQGTQTTFQHQDVPDRSPTGPLAYYLPGDLITFTGNVVQPSSGGSPIYSDEFFSALFTSLAWIQAWHGTPVQSAHVLGADWSVIEFVVNGQRYSSNVRQIIAASTVGTYPFEVEIFVPFSSVRIADLELETSQLALLARASQLQINVAPSSALTALSTGATFTNFKARCDAILSPRQELVLGTPIETILTQIVAGAGNSVKITNFGTDTGLQGVDPGGGLLALLFLTSQLGSEKSLNLQNGSFASTNITDFVWQWRGQSYTQSILALLSQWKRLLPTPLQAGLTTNFGSAPLLGMPYPVQNSIVENPATSANVELQNLLFWALVLNGQRPRLTALQTADSDQTFNMTVTGGYSGTHQILGFYARSWQAQMQQNWLAQVMAGGGGSLAAYVLGPNYGSAKMARRGAAGKHYTTADEQRYLPWQLAPASVVG
jgi:hypothetical protein